MHEASIMEEDPTCDQTDLLPPSEDVTQPAATSTSVAGLDHCRLASLLLLLDVLATRYDGFLKAHGMR